MNYRKTLSIFCYLFFFTAVCPAQEMNNTFLRIQDSINAMQQLPGRGIANVKPFFSSGAPAKDLLNTHWSAGTLNEAGTTCFDTSQRSFVINDTAYFFSREPYPSADGNIFLSGLFASSSGAYNYGGFLAKLDYKGHVLWHRTYSWQNKAGYYFINYYRVMELQDGSIFLGGITNDLVNGNNNIIYTKTDKNGNVIWSKIYKSRLWGPGSGSADYYYIQQMKEDKLTGDIYVTGPTWSDGRTMMKINSTNGNIAWGKSYQGGGSFDFPIGLEVKTNEIRMFSKSLSYNNAIISMTRINKATGDTIACKYWVSSDTAGIRVDFLGADPLTVLNNGNYVLTGKTYGNYIYPPGSTAYYQASVVEFDNNLNFIKAYNFRNSIESNSSNTVITTYPDGSSFFTMLHYISGYTADVYSIQLSNGQIVRQRMKHTTLGLPYEPQAVRAPDGGDLIMRLVGDTTDGVNKIEVMNLHTSDTASACLGINDNSTYLYPFNVVPSQFYTGTVQSDVFEETTNQNIISTFTTDHYLPGCVQVSNCDSIKLIPSATLLCKSQKLIITGKKNIGCGSNIVWQYNTQGITSASQPNDSTLEINFSGAWSGYIYGSIRGCSVKTDSVFINVIQTPASIDLGADFSICPGNTKLLNAHYGFLSYKWQTGSTDSTFLATQPGTYYVSATDACGVTLRDTIIAIPHSQVVVSIGPDRTKCNNDTLMLKAPPGFLSYSWSPNYNINALDRQVVIVNPAVDTSYVIKVEEEPGCFGFDTVKVKLYKSPDIKLGNDTSFCSIDSVVLAAGPGFINYNWSTGGLNEHITVSQVGVYSVTGTTSQGCRSSDTLKVLQVYKNPVVTLDQQENLCKGSSKILDAGAYSGYIWQNGALNRTIMINDKGVYYVTVTDTNGCKGSDTTRIKTLFPLPQGFLPNDISKCSFEKITLKPNNFYNAYLWNTNNRSAAIIISEPGLYWLEATDQNKCTGRDSIIITQRQCMKGLYVPTAFTPNSDGKNDLLKAFLFGVIKKFEFSIYNRYGQLVFFTRNVNEGWNGMYTGQQQGNGAFVWKCQYQLDGEPLQEEHGTVILLR